MISQSMCPLNWADRLMDFPTESNSIALEKKKKESVIIEIYRNQRFTQKLKCSNWNMITRALSDLVAGVSSILAVKTTSSLLIIWCESWQLPVFQQAGPPNGFGWDSEWQTVRCFQTDLHSFTWNLFDICRLLASHKHIFANSNNEKRHHGERIRLTEVFFVFVFLEMPLRRAIILFFSWKFINHYT